LLNFNNTPATVTGKDGKQYKAKKERAKKPKPTDAQPVETDDAADAEDTPEPFALTQETQYVNGLDSKTVVTIPQWDALSKQEQGRSTTRSRDVAEHRRMAEEEHHTHCRACRRVFSDCRKHKKRTAKI
jgi:hypothetical protein